MFDIEKLQRKINILEKENQYLKSLLSDAGIPYEAVEDPERNAVFEPDQGARILRREITANDANRFFSMFWGRTDVYSKRTVKKSTRKVNYYTQCYNFWKSGHEFFGKGRCRG